MLVRSGRSSWTVSINVVQARLPQPCVRARMPTAGPHYPAPSLEPPSRTRHLPAMRYRYRIPPHIDMTVDGRFVSPRCPNWPMRVATAAILVALVAGALAIAMLALWLIAALLPIAIIAVAIAWVAYKFQAWRGYGTARDPHDIYRP